MAQGLVTQDQLRIALQEQRNTGKPLGDTLLTLGFIPEESMRGALAERLGERAISLKGVVADPKALALIPKALAKRHQLFPVSLENNELLLASADPNDIVAADQINALLAGGPQPRWALASNAEILSAIELFYGHELSIDGILHELESGTLDTASLSQANEGYSHPVIRLIDS
jgi:general secretion pathway protein E/type IV pilus assembly protein PilB